jgi:hypothetical protein
LVPTAPARCWPSRAHCSSTGATCAEGGIVITLIWLAIWFIADLSGGHEPLLFDPVNTWTATLILAFALDFARPDSFKPGRD